MKINKRKLIIRLAENCMNLTGLRSNGVAPATLTKVNGGKDVTPATVGRIAKALGCSVTDIIEEEE